MTKKELKDVSYIGDGVYVGHDDFQWWLYTSNGIEETNFIALEPNVATAFDNYRERIREKYKNIQEKI
jgi:hypothetical protein